jgi:prolipoprotein diacylglyceryltransferase
MHPVLFEIPGLGFPVRTFGALVAAGILVGLWVWGKLLARHGRDPKEDPQRASNVAMWLVVGILVGARLFYVVVESTRYLTADLSDTQVDYLAAGTIGDLNTNQITAANKVRVGYDFIHDPLQILFIWQGGLVMYGGLIGGILIGLLGAKRHGLNPWSGLDTGLLSGFIGLAIGRWGCLFVGDDYGERATGSLSDFARPIHFGNGGELGLFTLRVPDAAWLKDNPQSLFAPEDAGQVLWATQTWMSANALLIALLGYVWLRLCPRHGVPAALMLLQYAVCRYAIENFRGDPVRGVWFGDLLSTSQLVSLALFAVGGALLARRWRAAAGS